MIATASTAARPAAPHASDRIFFSTLAVVLALTVFAGFASSYYLPLVRGDAMATLSGGPFTPLVHLHGALFSAWVVLFLVQTLLVAARRVALHRRLGVAGVMLAAAMVPVGIRAAVATAARGGGPPGIDPLEFLVVPLFDVGLFGAFVAWAVVRRRNREAHKRLMLLAYVNIVTAAIARLPAVSAVNPLAFFGVAFLVVVAGAVYDYRSRGRVHPVYLWGGSLFAASVPLRVALSGTDAWHAFARFLIS
jgi:hypothetical protein